jgi:ABC-type multidrug transport system ATPase subunit
MLELNKVSLHVRQGNEVHALLNDITAAFPRNHFAAVIGPSGCGKSTLLKAVAGIAPGEEEGSIFWNKRDLQEEDFEPSEIGYVPQFSIAHQELTVLESVEMAIRLRVGGLKPARRREVALEILGEVGMEEFSDRRVAVLSGGQQRRLSLAMEITSRPHILLCDEVTSGLDPQAEDEIVHLLHDLSRGGGRLILSVTHSLNHLELYDSVLVLYRGVLAYHGPASEVGHYFQVEDPAQLYAILEARAPEDWAKSWRKHHTPYQRALLEDRKETAAPAPSSKTSPVPEEAKSTESGRFVAAETGDSGVLEIRTETVEERRLSSDEPAIAPGAMTQFLVLLERRFLIFSRNAPQILLQLGLIFGFPLLVAVFAWNGLPNIVNLSMGLDQDVVRQLTEAREFVVQATKIGSLVSGIVMFQVILLTLMGANNSGREIAAERLIFEKEKLSGLRPLSYIGSKAVFLAVLVLVQSVWMGLFVHFVCGLPGDLGTQLLFLVLVNAAMTSICLALSSWLANAEQASLASIYLVGFQLPLSGAVLALPEAIGAATRPFIAAYWSWSGILQTLREERYYDIVQMVVQTSLSPAVLCLWVLAFHVVVGLVLAWMGCQRSRIN